MIGYIIENIINKLKTTFDYDVFQEPIEANDLVTKPAFSLRIDEVKKQRMIKGNKKISIIFAITFHPKEKSNTQKEYGEVMEKIIESFDYLITEEQTFHLNLVTPDDRITGTTFYLNITFYAKDQSESIVKMSKVEVKIDEK